jgi:HK97 family phage prohead protease
MEPDFSGYATKAGLKCSDGRTIMPDAFKHQNETKVPLVWQHGHSDPENVLGHAILENRDDGVYAYGYFNESPKAKHSHTLIAHKDITMMSIWANDLIERSGRVLHGAIREVSLVLSGANPGALIENVTIRHSDDEDIQLEDEAIIYTGLSFDHSVETDEKEELVHDDVGSDDKGVKAVYDSMSDKQKELLHVMLGEAMSEDEDAVTHQDNTAGDGEETVQDVYDSMSDKQKQVLHYMIGEALKSVGSDQSMAQDNLDEDENDDTKGNSMKHNVFEEEKGKDASSAVLSHSDVQGIIADASRGGSLKDAVENYAIAHGIDDIDILFPDAVSTDSVPQFLQRRVEWVAALLAAIRKSPFSRIKTFAADITVEEARAKGYIKGTLKKEEFFGVTRRVTTPTTIYKKQALDRDDVIDITDFDVVAWLKSEMRLMLDEELARAVLIGDGRDVSNEDKINEQNIRPIATDHELFVTTITVNVQDASSSVNEIVDAIIANRRYYKGTGQPTMFTTETVISQFLLLRDTLGRRIYKSIEEVASELRVASIVPVEAMEEDDTILAIIVNPVDYVLGATRGGEVSMFDDFDIDYNKQKYLIETRCSGALTKLKSAIVVRGAAGTDTVATPTDPTFNSATGVVTIPTAAGVAYKNTDTGATLTAGAQAALSPGATLNVNAEPTAGHYFATNAGTSWSFTAPGV